MRLYQTQRPFYFGIDLHANTMSACAVAADGRKCLHEIYKFVTPAVS
jgi:hypothetical protein